MIKAKLTPDGMEYTGTVKELTSLIEEYKRLGGDEDIIIGYIPGGRMEAAPDLYRKGYDPKIIIPDNQEVKK